MVNCVNSFPMGAAVAKKVITKLGGPLVAAVVVAASVPLKQIVQFSKAVDRQNLVSERPHNDFRSKL